MTSRFTYVRIRKARGRSGKGVGPVLGSVQVCSRAGLGLIQGAVLPSKRPRIVFELEREAWVGSSAGHASCMHQPDKKQVSWNSRSLTSWG